MPCALCTDPALCTTMCRAFEFAPAAVRSELLRQCEASGQMSAAQIHAHEQAGEFAAPVEIGPLTDIHGVVAGEKDPQ